MHTSTRNFFGSRSCYHFLKKPIYAVSCKNTSYTVIVASSMLPVSAGASSSQDAGRKDSVWWHGVNLPKKSIPVYLLCKDRIRCGVGIDKKNGTSRRPDAGMTITNPSVPCRANVVVQIGMNVEIVKCLIIEISTKKKRPEGCSGLCYPGPEAW